MPKLNQQTFTPEQIASHNKFVAEVNRAWSKQKENERKERVCETLNLDQKRLEVNSQPSSSESKTSFDKVTTPKM